MDVQEAYTAWAATYDSMENPTRDLDGVATREMLGERRYGEILELGCGTGKNTVFLAEIGDRVQALDFTEAMMEKARAKVAAPNVSFAAADITQSWPCADGVFDLVVTNLVLEHIEDLGHIYAEAARCLKPGGWLFISELHPYRQYGGLKANFEFGEETVTIPAFVHAISDFLDAGREHGLALVRLAEWWHQPDRNKPPLVVSFLFEK